MASLAELGEFSKAMSPNKLAGLRSAANRGRSGDPARRVYAQRRLDQYGLGAGVSNPRNGMPSIRERGMSAAYGTRAAQGMAQSPRRARWDRLP